MHRTYNPVLPTPSKLLQQRWDQTYYNEHRRKVRDVAPMVDTRAPATYMHLHLKLKKLQLEEERLATIERDNRILLEKMSYIMRTRGRIDNRNNYEYKSLNREKRQRELLRVTTENQDILRRIMVRDAEYSAENLQRDWEQNQKFMDNIARFPRDWWKREDTRMSKRSGSRRSSAQSRKHKRNQDDNVSTKSDAGQEKEQKESDESKNVKSQKDSKAKKDTKNKDAKKTSDDEGKKEGSDKDTKNEDKQGEKKVEEEEGVKGVKG